MTKRIEYFLRKIENHYFENLIEKIFEKNHKEIKNFDDLKNGVKIGKI